jgi:pyruvate dehydrogenase E2 component (dihydrolipoamide acetyltransferase)
MAIDVTLPELGEGIDSGDVLEILVKEGDFVKADQGLLELETDKATVTVPSPAAGKVLKILVSPGDSVPVGNVVAQLESSSGASQSESPQKAAPQSPAAAPKPAEPRSASQAAEADQDSAPAAPATPAAAQQARPAPAAPAPTPTAAAHTGAAAPQASPAKESGREQPSEVEASVPAGPAVRRFAREVGVDLQSVSGTGDGGRITREDVLRAVRESSALRATSNQAPASTALATTSPSAPAAAATSGNKGLALPGQASQDDYGPVRVERLSKIRKTIASQMHKSWSTVPRVTNFDDADVTDLEAFRASSKDDYAAEGIKLTTMPFLIKAVATALRHHPTMNALLDLDNDQITYRDYVNLGIAIDTERGLVVPNIRHADALSFPDIAKALADVAARVRSGDFGVNELRGGTFTISNLGAIGGTYSTPIVNVPEVAILLVGRTRKLPVVMDDDSIKARLMMPLSLSYDHRLVDGGTAARFLNDVIAYLEAPSRLLLAIN